MMYSEAARLSDLADHKQNRDSNRDDSFAINGVNSSSDITDFELSGPEALANMTQLITQMKGSTFEVDAGFFDEVAMMLSVLDLFGASSDTGLSSQSFGFKNNSFADAKESFFTVDYVNAFEAFPGSGESFGE
ncbi:MULTISPECIES: hypothetical protein [unclassified Pseudovibrio]|uniref:hypothetical protein n=1 Tax=unclassified Pseudovibrio TaxID=2627060 RepID=UPI0007AE53B1|nr:MULTISPECIES: hypothetical protein [unclassified Pseudovibrio]KZK94484.1 hypothetical protein PsW74_04626 [Pseudovibrio sp. W74]KZL07246.1 hypothetical protein PsAD14_03628 [Pseudovibrio sp. Ad14]